MKSSAIPVLLLVPTLSLAQNFQGMSEAEMQSMMQQMQKMQTCMQDIDQGQLNALEQRSRQMESEINSLCAKGKRDKAQQTAISYGKKMMNDPAMKTMRKCGEMMRGAMPNMPYMGHDEKQSSRHVCD